jgi:hypothetical protein
LLRKTASVITQKLRTPVRLNDAGAELATNVSFVPPATAKPAAKNVYPLFVPLESTLSIMQAVVELGEHAAAGPPKLINAAA